MANSKANIYPVKLQGAELNLNKFDAEIKQYSGFNKNNAPFVGGCLSPIFNKKDTSYPFDNNTYVDKNGDVYYLDTSNETYNFFRKNGTAIKAVSKTGYDVVECSGIDENAVYVLDENCYMTTNQNEYFLKVDGKSVHNNNLIMDYSLAKNLHSSTQSSPVIGGSYSGKVLFGKFSIYKKTVENTDFIFIIGNVIDYESHIYSMAVGYKKDTDGVYRYFWAVGKEVDIDYEGGFLSTPIAKFSGTTLNTFKMWFFNQSGGSSDFSCICDFFDQYGIWWGSQFRGTIVTENNKYLYFAEDHLHYVGNNKAILNYALDFDNATITVTNYRRVSNITQQSATCKRQDVILTPWGVSWAAHFDNGTNEVNLSVVGNQITPYGSYDSTEGRAYNAVGSVFNDVVLMNNGLASGIRTPTDLLVTEWNSVDLNYIFFGENTTTWKNTKYVCLWKNINNNKWYKLVKSESFFKVLNDQIIFNCLIGDKVNSYRITDGKFLCYAPAWNNRHPYIADGNITGKAINSVKDEYYASAINEYNLKDNASIILNPVRIKAEWQTVPDMVIEFVSDVKIDYYKGVDSAVYWYSSLGENGAKGKNRDLIDLPFPSDTNGNIQYSPSLFSEIISAFGNDMFILVGDNAYQLMKINNATVFSFYMATMIENLSEAFILQGQYYVIINNVIYSATFSDGVIQNTNPVVSVLGLKYCGNTPYQAFFFSKTNKCIYVFNGSNVLQQMQFVDKYDDINFYKYNPATQSIFLITDNDVLVYSAFGIFTIDVPGVIDLYLLDDGVCLLTDKLTYVKYYLDNTDTNFEKVNIDLETCFYGSNNELVTVNDCLYMRLFNEEHEEGKVVISATTLTNEGRETDKTTFTIKSSDWDKMTHSIYLRYQPKYQRGLGISFKINSPFKIASLSVGNVPDTILIDKVSKGAVNAPQKTTTSKWT